MLSFDHLRVIADERERSIQRDLRVRRLLRTDEPEPGHPRSANGLPDGYAEGWRARTSRASATTR